MTTVLAHGVFDMLHIGHVRHLMAAREMGDTLIVSVTADKFVNKGPGRPVFNDSERRMMLQALKWVDGVVLSNAHNAVATIEHIRPDIFVKGPDYAKSGIDLLEADAVYKVGGRVEFTQDPFTFSSSHLINYYMRPDEQRDCLMAIDLQEIWNAFEEIKDYKVLVVGDEIIDRYTYVSPMGKPSKEPILSCCYEKNHSFAGGVQAVANYLRPFVGTADVFDGYLKTPMPTTIKERFVDPSTMRKLFEVYTFEFELNSAEKKRYRQNLLKHMRNYDLVVVADFGHGLIDKETAEVLSENAHWLALTCQMNSGNRGFNRVTKYPGANYICMDIHEARRVADDPRASGEQLAREMTRLLDCPKGVVTLGKDGCATWFVWGKEGGVHLIPSFADKVIDTLGAGDAFLAVTAPLVKAGMPMNQVGFVGNVMGALKVTQVGQAHITKQDLFVAIKSLLK